jgi:6-phosphogluconolactonase
MRCAFLQRSFTSGLALVATAAIAFSQSGARAQSRRGAQLLAYISTYTVHESKGIYVYSLSNGRLKPMGVSGLAVPTVNPSFVAVDPTHRFLYAVNETENFQGQASGAVSAFSIDRKTGKLTFLNQVASGGTDPCFVSLDRTGKWVMVANYTSGSISVFSVLRDGRLGPASAFIQHHGHGANPVRQEGPHCHMILASPDNRFVLVADLGLDKLFVYRFNSKRGTLTPNNPPFATVSPGSGPRHFAFDPTGHFVYLLSEVRSTLTAFAYNPARGSLHEMQTISALPEGFTGQNTAAEIAVSRSDRFLYASNRGADSLAVFAIDPQKHTLKPLEHVPSLGKTPRGFAIDPTGRYLVAANQDSDNIFVFRINPKTGELKPTGQALELSSPVSVAFVPAP